MGPTGTRTEVLPGDVLEFGPHVVRVTKVTYGHWNENAWEGVSATPEELLHLKTITVEQTCG